MPGDNFFAKICNYINDHYDELYMKFNKDACKVKREQQCASCTNGCQGPKDRIPLPFSDKETFRYKSVFKSSATSPDRKTRPVDDFMSRAQIKKCFNEEKLNAAKDMEEFSRVFVVSQELVKNYVDHLKYLKFSKDFRNNSTAEKRRNRGAKKYDDYNWDGVLLSRGLSCPYAFELDTYLKKHSLQWKKK